MATKKKSTKKISKKKSSKKTSKKKTSKKVSKKKVARKKSTQKKRVVKKAHSEDLFNPSAAEISTPSATWTPPVQQSDSAPDESKSTMGRIGVIAVLAGLVIAFAIMQKNDFFGDKKENPQNTEEVSPIVEDKTSSDEEKTDATTQSEENKTEETTSEKVEESTTTGTEKSYTVKKGDTLYKIAVSQMGAGTGTNINAIKKANNLTSNSLSQGTVLKIPVK